MRHQVMRQAGELQKAREKSDAGRAARYAALNLMEDAVQAQQALEQENGERRRAEVALRASEEKYRTLFDSIDEGFCIIEMIFDTSGRGCDYRFIETNPAFELHTGLKQALGRTVRELVPHHEPHWFEIYARVSQTGVSVRCENSAAALGRYYDVYAFRAGEPQEHRVAVLFRDISERKRQEQRQKFRITLSDALRPLMDAATIKQECLRIISETLDVDRVLYGDVMPDGRMLLISDHAVNGATSISGQVDAHDFGVADIDKLRAGGNLIIGDVASAVDLSQEARAAYLSIQARAVVTVPLNKNGRWVSNLAVHHGKPRQWTAHEVDILQDAAERTWEAVERARVETELRAAKEEAEHANRAKDDFLAALSHELRNPLNPVLLCASDMAEDPSLPPHTREDLRMIHRNVELEARLIDDLLDLTRISRGKMSIHCVPNDAHTLLRHTQEIVKVDAASTRVNVKLQMNAEECHLLADAGRMQQVFWNLIKNGIKFSSAVPDGEVIVRTYNPSPGNLVVEVEDNGVGMTAEAIAKIFHPFEQGDHSGSHRFGGLGLGLAISKAIVDLHQGEMHAESAGPGCGSLFQLRLPTITAPAALPPNAQKPVPMVGALRLLLVEDHESTLRVLQNLLERDGHSVHPARNAQEALAFAEDQDCDLVISDIGLPDRSGVELMRELRKMRGWPGIALSGYGMDADLAESLAAGFLSHLVKPLEIEALRKAIREAMRTREPV